VLLSLAVNDHGEPLDDKDPESARTHAEDTPENAGATAAKVARTKPEFPVALVSDGASLVEVLDRIDATKGPLALDTEADSFHHYFEKVCLIQIATEDRVFLVDPLVPASTLDLSPLMERLSTRLLLLHGADYDLRLLNRTYGFRASAIFDTMIAAQLLGEPEIGLAALLGKHMGVTLDKTNQRADWS